MKKVIKYKESSSLSQEEILQNIRDNNGCCYFEICCDWEGVGYDHLNAIIDEEIDNGCYFNDVTYNPVKLNDDGSLIFEVCVSDTDDYVHGCSNE